MRIYAAGASSGGWASHEAAGVSQACLQLSCLCCDTLCLNLVIREKHRLAAMRKKRAQSHLPLTGPCTHSANTEQNESGNSRGMAPSTDPAAQEQLAAFVLATACHHS